MSEHPSLLDALNTPLSLASSGFKVFDPGEYDAIVEEVTLHLGKEKTGKNGAKEPAYPYLKVKLAVLDEEQGATTVFPMYSLSPAAAWKLNELVTALTLPGYDPQQQVVNWGIMAELSGFPLTDVPANLSAWVATNLKLGQNQSRPDLSDMRVAAAFGFAYIVTYAAEIKIGAAGAPVRVKLDRVMDDYRSSEDEIVYKNEVKTITPPLAF